MTFTGPPVHRVVKVWFATGDKIRFDLYENVVVDRGVTWLNICKNGGNEVASYPVQNVTRVEYGS